MMLTVHNLAKRYADTLLFEEVTFSVNRGERVGLLGPNGSGKSTLLRILAGLEMPDAGNVTYASRDLRLGYLPQGFEADPEATIADILPTPELQIERQQQELARLSLLLAGPDPSPAIVDAYDRTLHALAELDHVRGRPAPRDALGLSGLPPSTPVRHLSGGQKTRLALARILAGQPELLLLDEPTNHLDLAMLEWLETWLLGFDGGALIVSHDRALLDRAVSRILELAPDTHRIRSFSGNFSVYLEQSSAERDRQLAAYRDQQAEVRRMKADIARIKEQARNVERGTINDQQRRYAKKVARKATSREKKLARFVSSDERVRKPGTGWQMKVDFAQAAHLGRDVLTTEDLTVGYSAGAPLLHDLNLTIRRGDRIALIGPNGSGKTTLLRTLASELRPLAGRVRLGPSVRLGFMSQDQELLDKDLSALQTLQAARAMSETQARTFLHLFLFEGDDSLRRCADLSYGERARLTLALLVARGSTFLLLDEPINHLDIPSRIRFEQALAGFEGTILAVVHDRYFIQRFAGAIWEVSGQGVLVH